jgi:hypothetical protein
VSRFVKSVGWTFLRFALGLPAFIVAHIVLVPWARFSEPLLLPIVGKSWLNSATLFPFLALILGAWMATIKLAEFAFEFRFPPD